MRFVWSIISNQRCLYCGKKLSKCRCRLWRTVRDCSAARAPVTSARWDSRVMAGRTGNAHGAAGNGTGVRRGAGSGMPGRTRARPTTATRSGSAASAG